MARLDRVTQLVLLAGYDYLRLGHIEINANDLRWPDEPCRVGGLLDLSYARSIGQQTEALFWVVSLEKRITCLNMMLGEPSRYTQLHLDIFFLAFEFDQEIFKQKWQGVKQSAIKAAIDESIRKWPSLDQGFPAGATTNMQDNLQVDSNLMFNAFRVEAAIRRHISVRFGVCEDVVFDVDLYCRQQENPAQFRGTAEACYFLPAYCDSGIANSEANANTTNVISAGVDTKREPTIRDQHFDNEAARILELKRQLEIVMGLLSSSESERIHILEDYNNLKANFASIKKENERYQLSVDVLRKSLLSPKREHEEAQSNVALRLPNVLAKRTAPNQLDERLLDGFTKQLDKNLLIRGDELLKRMRVLRLCPSDWRLSTWDGRLGEKEDTEEWKILLVEPPADTGVEHDAYVLVAPRCSISDTLMRMFDGCSGHSFDARVTQTVRPAHIRFSVISSFTVVPPKGEVNVT